MRISVITATYNCSKTIALCLQSIQNQKIDIEHLCIDGNSTDGTLDILVKQKKTNIKIISEPDKGIYDALNKGIKIASGDIIGILHADDEFYNDDTISKISNSFKETDADVIYGDLVYTSVHNTSKIIRYWKSRVFNKYLLKKGWMPPHPTVFMKKEVYHRHGLFDLNYKIAADYDYMLRVFSDPDLKITYLPIVITRMRMGGSSNKNLKNILRKSHEDYEVIKKNNLPYPLWVLFLKNISKVKQFFMK
ncbi:MAG: glycosyltransferase [Bacteroidetes bacterium]|nr:glycosyltransferase [Bacteroidota bacterium]